MTYSIRPLGSITEIGQLAWDQCANPVPERDCQQDQLAFDPFVSYHFLHALEESGSATAETGWAPYHLLLEDEQGTACGVVPMYLKNHSQGEYVFDYSWADAFERAGGRYYPKLQIAVPFTPATGRRVLTKLSTDVEELEQYLISGVMQIAQKLGVSSVHVTFANRKQYEHMGKLGFLQRTHNQFHWLNNDYQCFDDFLSQLSSKKRKNIRRERRIAVENDIEIECLTGTDITESHWDAFYRFYVDTGSRKWGSPYLTRQFFSLIGESMAENILLVMCRRGSRYVAGAINFIGGECLFGRNWGCLEHHPLLHFEVCYYQAIAFAIDHGLKRVEAGAQGQHKLARGYLPTHTYSAHWIVNKSFSDAVHSFLEQERQYVDEEIDYIEGHSPFKKVDPENGAG